MLVQGATGGVGTAVLQVARGLGARTIAVVWSDEKEAVATGSRRSKASANSTRVVTGTKARLTAISATGTATPNRIFEIGSPESTRP